MKLLERICLVEFKVVELEPEGKALAQMKAKDYAAKYRAAGVPIHLVGIEFSRESRRVAGDPEHTVIEWAATQNRCLRFCLREQPRPGRLFDLLAPQALPSTENAGFVPKQCTERLVFDIARRCDGAYPSWYSAKR